MNLVQQEGKYDCGVACLAMVLGKSLQEVESRMLLREVGVLRDPNPSGELPSDVIGVSMHEMLCALSDHGIRHLWLDCAMEGGETWYSRCVEHMPILRPVSRIIDHINGGGVAILGVHSLTSSDGLHWIVADGVRLLDPQSGNVPPELTYEVVSDEKPLTVHEAILIRPEVVA